MDVAAAILTCVRKTLNGRKEENGMKRIVFWGIFIQVFILMGLVSYAAMTREPISKGNLCDLKGKWEGWRTVGVGGSHNARTELEIYNDTLPLKGKFLFEQIKRQDRGGGTGTMEFKAGKIENGNFYLKAGQNYWELSLHKDDGKMKLEGDFYFRGAKGTMSLKKK